MALARPLTLAPARPPAPFAPHGAPHWGGGFGGHPGGDAERATELRRLRSAREKAARHARGFLRRGQSWRPPQRLSGKQPLGMPVGAAVAALAAGVGIRSF